MRSVWGLVALAACGDNRAEEPRPLVADLAVQVGCAPGPVTTTRAKRVDCAEELVAGRLASGRIGDFVLENANLRVVVRGAGDGYYLHGTAGGGIVDAAVIGGEDLVKEIQPAVDFAFGAFDELVITEAGDDGPAELVVRGPATHVDIISAALARPAPELVIEHHYRLAEGADAIELETRVFAMSGSVVEPPTLYDAMFLGGRARAFLPGRGFLEGTGGAEIVATAGTTTSYGLTYPTDTPDPQLVDLAGIRLIVGPSLEAGRAQRRWLVLGDGSVASVTGHAWAQRGAVLGAVRGTTAPLVDVMIADAAGAPITVARADAAGAFAATVPPGAYQLHAEAIGAVPGASVAASVSEGADTVIAVPAGPSGTVTLAVRDGSGARIPARVVLDAGEDQRIEYVGASGDATLAVAPGTWRIAVSRGLEYDAFVASAVTIADGQTVPLSVTLDRVVDTSGWISLDTHLHSELSTDSTFPIDERLRAVAAEGVELPVSSDHDVAVDYAPIIAELGLGTWVGALTGTEASSIVWGHVNAFPITVDPARSGGGAPRWLGRAPAEVFAALRAGDATRIVQVNHPRFGTTSLFDAIDLDPRTLTARRAPAALGLPANTDLSDLGFDAVEVANRLAADDFERVFADWLAMVTAGHRAAATGSSDSHGANRFAGESRTYVWVGAGADDPATIDPAVVSAAIRARHVVIGGGAFVTAGIVSGTTVSLPGEIVDVTGRSQVALHIRVQAAAWQPLARIRIFEGMNEVRTIALEPTDTAPVRFDADVVLPAPASDTFWVVRVDNAGSGDPVFDSALPAFTNPIFARVN